MAARIVNLTDPDEDETLCASVEDAEQALAAMDEAMVVWEDYGVTLGELINDLGTKESTLSQAVWRHVDSLNPNTPDEEQPNLDVLYSLADHDTPDPSADDYEAVMETIREHLGPKIRMD